MLSTMSKPVASPKLMTKVLLDPKILEKILHSLDTNSLLAARYVCRTWHTVSSGPLQQRLTLERTASVYLEGTPSSWPADYVSRWFRLMVLEWDERAATDEELAIESDADIGLSIYSPCPGLLSFLPESVWAERISVLCFDHSLTVQDWNEGGCLLVSGLRSLRRLDMRFGQLWGIWKTGMNFGRFCDNDVIEEVHVKLDDSVFSEATKALYDVGVFDMMFLWHCPKLQRLSLNLENHRRVYREMLTASCKRLGSGQWSVELFSKLAEGTDHEHALQTELRAMFAYIPVEELAVKLISGVDPVVDIVTGAPSLKKLKIDCTRVRYGFNLIARLIDTWSRIPVFSSVIDLTLEFRDDENRIGKSVCLDDPIDAEVWESYGDMSSLANVTKLELVHQQVEHWDCGEPETGTEAEAAVSHSLDRYWTEVLRYMPNVQILVAAAAARCQFLQAMNLPKLKHIVVRQGFDDVVVYQPNKVFARKLQELVAHLKDLRSFTLDFEEDPDWDKSSNCAPYYIAARLKEVLVGFAGKSPIRLVQINSPFLINVELKPQSSETADIEVRVFNAPHGLLYECFRNEPAHVFDANIEYPDLDMLPELQPVTIAFCNERNANSF